MFKEIWPKDEPRQNRSDVCWETEREELNIRQKGNTLSMYIMFVSG